MDTPNTAVIVAIVAPLLLAQLALTIIALIDLRRRDEASIRHLPKWAWAVIILFINLIGAIAYLVAGREE